MRWIVPGLALLYSGMAAVCLLAPQCLPELSIAGLVLLGPPGMLLWGMPALGSFLLVSVVLAALLWGMTRSLEMAPFALSLAVVIWLAVGFVMSGQSI